MNKLELKITYRPADLFKMNVWNNIFKKAFLIVVLFWIILGLQIVTTFKGSLSPQEWSTHVLQAVLSVAAALVLVTVFIGLRTRKLFKQDKMFSAETTVTIEDDQLVEKSALGQHKVRLSDLESVIKTQGLLLLFESATKVLILPRRAFASGQEFDQLYARLAAVIKAKPAAKAEVKAPAAKTRKKP